jgi:hypothetical protein
MVEPPGGGLGLVLELVKVVPVTQSCKVPSVTDCCDVLPLVIRVSVWFGAPKRPEACCEVPACVQFGVTVKGQIHIQMSLAILRTGPQLRWLKHKLKR